MDEVHVWHVDLAAMTPGEKRWHKILSSDELEREERFSSQRSRHTFTTTRAILRIICSAYVNAEPEALIFSYSDQRKPFLRSPHAGWSLEFNVSHSCNLALLAFAQARVVGVDVEHIGRDLDHEALAKRFFSPNEQLELNALPASERHLAFLRGWARKEAYLKAIGTGLTNRLNELDFSLKPENENAALSRAGIFEAREFYLRDIPAGEGYVATLCVQGQDWRLVSGFSNP